MTTVSHWLDSLGLGEYRRPFAENAIDASVLRDLTEQDLTDLGVRVGHRRKLLRAIAELRAAELRAPDAPAGVSAPDDGERRHLTVLFCDLVGSAAFAERLDLDDVGKIMTSYHECVAGVIARHGGFVDERQGDGVLALFGFPEAHEDDTERAVHAGLALADAVDNLKTEAGAPLQVRVGIATGSVVVRREVGQGQARKQRVVGEPPNLAARLQTLAKPGAVVICANTRALAGGLFDCRALGASPLKGWAESVAAWQILGPSGVESRFEARHASRLAPPFGRDEELELLQRRWKHAADGEGRVVILTGEAGIGKSHIVLTMQERLAAEPHTRLRYFCSAHHGNSALFPFIGQLERAARFERRDSSEERRAKLAALFAESLPHTHDAVPLVANLLSLPTTACDELQELTPQKRKERTLAVLLAQLEATAARQPVLMIFEDAQWIDPTSLELLTLLVERVPQLPILLLITARTKNEEFRPLWASQPHVKTMVLNYLGRRDSEALARRVAAGKTLPDDVMEEILDRADGVPLYVEEYTKTVLNRSSPSLAIPNTLRASLMERLDRLGEARHVAQTAAVVGREFSYELLSAVLGPHVENLDAALGELVRSELVFQRGALPHAVYRFKHVLLRDEAYEGLVKTRRVALHAEIASALEEKFPEIIAAQPETLGHHLSRAGLPRRALPYWLEAGRNAARRFANLEAIAHLRKGIEEAGALPEDRERDRLELELTFELGQCLIATQGPASGQSLEAFNRARQLCERLGEAPQYPQVMFWFATAGVVRGELERALEATAAMQGAAEAQGDPAAVMNSVRGQGMIRLFMGRLVEAKEGIEHALALFNDADETQRLAARAAGQDSGAAALAQLSWVLWLMGSVDAAVVRIEAALERAQAIGHPHTEAYTSYYASILYALRGEYERAQRHATRCLKLSEEHGFQQWLGLSHAIRGTSMSMLAPSSSTLEEVHEALEKYRDAGYQLGITVLHVLRCQALLVNRRPEAALEAAEHGLSTVERNNERILEAELCRLKARALLHCAAPHARANARLWLERAVATARSQGARSLELRAANDLAGL
jgi:predicted ATPase/class 3 adenylate cyclase